MRIDRILARTFLIAVFLTGCSAPAGSLSNNPVSPFVSVTRTPFLPANDTPVPASSTPTPIATETATLASTATPTPSLRVNLEAVGDIMLARTVGDQVLAQGPGIVFAGVQSVFYWSSTTLAVYTDSAWNVNLFDGLVNLGSKGYDTYYVWPVRGGQ